MSGTRDFSRGSIPRNILRMAVPMTAAQLVNILYNVVDRMYLGRLPGHLALTGLGLCLPVISILMAFANLCGMGGAPLCSIHRGRGEEEEAERIMGNSFVLLLILGAVLSLFCLVFRRPILYLFGASDQTFPYARDYLTIYLLGTLFVMIGLGMNPFINAQGYSVIGMLTVALGAVVNILLDPVFIFTLGLGVKGAALATIFSQACSALWVLLFLTGKRAALRLRLSSFRLQASRVRRILSLGLSGFVMSLTNSLVQILCNVSLQTYGGDLYVGVMTVVNSIREVISMPVTGITHGCQPVLGYNYGAQQYGRVRQGIRFTAAVTVGYSVAVWLATMLAPEALIRIFNDEPELIQAGTRAFRIYFAAFFCMSFQFIGQSTFVGLGKSKQAVFFSLLRKAFIVAPLTQILPPLGLGVDGVYLAEPISNVIGGAACLAAMYGTVYRPLGRLEAAQRKDPSSQA